MIFNELYSAYYNTVAAILARIGEGGHTEKELQKIVAERAFGESMLTILPSLKSEKWQLMHPDLTTPLAHKPTMPLTTLQREWLKAISLDPRIRLFDVEFPDLSDIEPLFTREDLCFYDRYSDGDPFENEGYIQRFRIILEAIRSGTAIKLEMYDRKGRYIRARCRPLRLEYSEKDDKFRVITAGSRAIGTVNLSRLMSCIPDSADGLEDAEERKNLSDTLTVKITDERNALERFLLHFAHFEKQAERLDKNTYLVKIHYAQDDREELAIRILSFGPLVEVLESKAFRDLIIERLKKQKSCGLG